MSKKIQGLRKDNLKVAIAIAKHLKDNGSINEKMIQTYYVKETGKCGYDNSTNWKTIKQFLIDYKVMTSHKINGFRVYQGTRKCFNTCIENMFNIYEECSNLNIDQAINWQKQNKGLIPIAMEARVIGQNFLGFSGKFLEQFIETTTQIQGFHNECNVSDQTYYNELMRFERKMSFLFALRTLKVKKIN